MSDFINKVITIASKEEKKTKTGTNTKIYLADQDGIKYSFFKKKKDGELSSAAQQLKDMELDEGSVVQISYVLDSYEVEGKKINENKVTGFRETNDTPVKNPTKTQTKEPTYHTEEKNETNWDEIAVGKCQTVFLQAFIQSGKSFSDAKLQVAAARQLAELVVYGSQQTKPEPPEQEDYTPLHEPPQDNGEYVDGDYIPF